MRQARAASALAASPMHTSSLAPVQRDVPGRVERLRGAARAARVLRPLGAVARQRAHALLPQVHLAQGVALGVRYVQAVALQQGGARDGADEDGEA